MVDSTAVIHSAISTMDVNNPAPINSAALNGALTGLVRLIIIEGDIGDFRGALLANISRLSQGVNLVELRRPAPYSYQNCALLVSKVTDNYFSFIETGYYTNNIDSGRYANGIWY